MPDLPEDPYWERDDVETQEVTPDPRHDALISNSQLSEAYNRAIEDGFSSNEAHYHARKEVFGEDWEPDFPEYYDGVDRLAENFPEDEEVSSDVTNEVKESGDETTDNPTLKDWGNDS